jgi:hypothetical protein
VADAKLKGVGVGLTQGRKDGGDATQYRSKAFWDYISRNHAHLLVTGNFSDIARRIIRAEDKREDGGWMDADWLNGADTGNKPYKPTFDSLRKLLSTKISGKG